MWDEAEWVINQFPYIYDEGTWLEMQIWEDNTLKKFYQNSENITDFVPQFQSSMEHLNKKVPLVKHLMGMQTFDTQQILQTVF